MTKKKLQMIRVIDTLKDNKPLEATFQNEDDFIINSFFTQKEKFALLGTLDTNKPVNHLPEIYGLRLELEEEK